MRNIRNKTGGGVGGVLPDVGDFKQFVGKELRARFPQTPSAGFVQAAP